ncbi:alkaline ceramidase family protein [Aspergillus cavernicola]|uniref:Alkaline ceramidase family protein n=1 Tax=Aspergillus cavernicola TaxID=176166 RepID=A0ABR4HDH0_9EURO
MALAASAEPFWGAPTANSNFCEQDYAITRYIAEFINSLSNLVYVIYGIYGVRKLRQKPNADVFRYLPYWGLMAVGLCSAVFHVSLKYHTQMMDDLSMLFATTPVLQRVLRVNATRRESTIMAIILWSMLAFLIVYHVSTDELILHSTYFGGMIVVIGIRTMQLVNTRTAPGSEARRQIWGIVRFGAVIFNVGFYLWIIDNWTCGYLTKAREVIGLPWAFVFELHGWWHICTGIGAYIFIAVVDHLASGEYHTDIEGSFAWPASWASRSAFAGKVPEVIEKSKWGCFIYMG